MDGDPVTPAIAGVGRPVRKETTYPQLARRLIPNIYPFDYVEPALRVNQDSICSVVIDITYVGISCHDGYSVGTEFGVDPDRRIVHLEERMPVSCAVAAAS